MPSLEKSFHQSPEEFPDNEDTLVDGIPEIEKSGIRRISPEQKRTPFIEQLTEALGALEKNDRMVTREYTRSLQRYRDLKTEREVIAGHMKFAPLLEGSEPTIEAHASIDQQLADLTERLNKIFPEAKQAQRRVTEYAPLLEKLATHQPLTDTEAEFYESLAPLLNREARRITSHRADNAEDELKNEFKASRYRDLAVKVSQPAEELEESDTFIELTKKKSTPEQQSKETALQEHKAFLEDQIKHIKADLEEVRLKTFEAFQAKAAEAGDPLSPKNTELTTEQMNERLDALNEDARQITDRLSSTQAELNDFKQIERHLMTGAKIDSYQQELLDQLSPQQRKAA